jgi:hypothetical protein
VEQKAPEMVEEDQGDSDEEERVIENEELNQSDGENEPEIEMNWNIMQFLPEDGACQTNFNVRILLILSPSLSILIAFDQNVSTQ